MKDLNTKKDDQTVVSFWLDVFQDSDESRLHNTLDTVLHNYRRSLDSKNLGFKKVITAQCDAIFTLLNRKARTTDMGRCISNDLSEYLNKF